MAFEQEQIATIVMHEVGKLPTPIREIEVSSLPIDGTRQTPNELVQSFRHNLALVIGGEIYIGQECVYTDGLFGRYSRIGIEQLMPVAQLEKDVWEGKDKYGGTMRVGNRVVKEPEAVTRARVESKKMIDDVRFRMDTARENVQSRVKELNDLMHEGKVLPRKKAMLDSVLFIEECIGNENFDISSPEFQKQLLALGVPTLGKSRENIAAFLQGIKLVEPLYVQYRDLVLGQLSGNQFYPGLRDFQRDFKQYTNEYNSAIPNADVMVAKAREEVAQWETHYRRLLELHPQAKIVTARLKYLRDIRDHLRHGYVPNVEAITILQKKVADGSTELQGEISAVLPDEATITRQSIIRWSRMLKEMTNPEYKLTLDVVPKDLAEAIPWVNEEGFNVDEVSSDQRVIAEMGMALLGKGRFIVDEIKKVVAPVDLSPAPQSIEQPVTQNDTVDMVVEPDLSQMSFQELAMAASQLSIDVLNRIDVERLTQLAEGGYLTLDQIGGLKVEIIDGQGAPLDLDELISGLVQIGNLPDMIGVLSASVNSIEQGSTEGIPGELLQPLMVSCLSKAANAVIHQYSAYPRQALSVQQLHEFLNRMAATNTMAVKVGDMLVDGRAILTVAQASWQVSQANSERVKQKV